MAYEDISATLAEEFYCGHEESALVRKERYDGKTPAVWRQCVQCGYKVSRVPVRELSARMLEDLPALDETLAQRYCEAKHARWKELYEQARHGESEQWWMRYQAYINSAAWKHKRRLVLERERRTQNRDEPLCQGCGLQCAEHVHHLDYTNIGNEFLWELVAVCLPCHRRLHPEGTL